jgi:PHD/YefM family antitoxin component YafN of YafNO toxin-antitoxin module
MSTESIIGSSKTEKINQFLMLMKDPEVQPFFRNYIENIIENVLATSDLQVLKRLSAVETVLGLDDFSADGDEDHELTVPKQLSLLAERIDDIAEITKKEPIPESVPILATKTEIRSHLLVEHLKNNVQERSGTKFLSSREIVSFLKYDIDEQYRVLEGQNIRQTKKEVLDKAVKLFPNNVFLSQKSHGRKNVRIICRP